MQNFSCDNEFHLHQNKISFSHHFPLSLGLNRFFFNQPWSQANSSCRQGEVLENSFYEPLILWMCFHLLLTSLSMGPSKVVVWTQWVTLFAPFWKRKQLEIVGKIFWKPSGYIFLDVTASFFKSVHALEMLRKRWNTNLNAWTQLKSARFTIHRFTTGWCTVREPDLQQIYERLARKSRDVIST